MKTLFMPILAALALVVGLGIAGVSAHDTGGVSLNDNRSKCEQVSSNDHTYTACISEVHTPQKFLALYLECFKVLDDTRIASRTVAMLCTDVISSISRYHYSHHQ